LADDARAFSVHVQHDFLGSALESDRPVGAVLREREREIWVQGAEWRRAGPHRKLAVCD